MPSNIAVIGTGYVGLTTGAYLGRLDHHVVCSYVVADKLERLNRGDIPILGAGGVRQSRLRRRPDMPIHTG